ncbi:hypothetical protein ACGFZK_21385 [Streptomyces sp. NPDC048257]|uniref:hypothetical protein n=1 Tax=Streptomyces sp. NPDC048257 TaxID=3365526 RepID=UPI0037145932
MGEGTGTDDGAESESALISAVKDGDTALCGLRTLRRDGAHLTALVLWACPVRKFLDQWPGGGVHRLFPADVRAFLASSASYRAASKCRSVGTGIRLSCVFSQDVQSTRSPWRRMVTKMPPQQEVTQSLSDSSPLLPEFLTIGGGTADVV